MTFTPENWFWQIGDDATRYWSSLAGAYVTQADTTRLTIVADEDQLCAALANLAITSPRPSANDYAAAVQAHIDAVARAKQYDSGTYLVGYKDSPVAAYAADAAAFIAWRDPLWVFVFASFDSVQQGLTPQPTIAELINSLPAPPWAIA